VRRPAGKLAALELQGGRHMMLHIDGGEGVDEPGYRRSRPGCPERKGCCSPRGWNQNWRQCPT
jgi:hypothetical protein